MSTIKRYDYFAPEYGRLLAAAEMLNAYNENGDMWEVSTVYFDLGQGWLWTTLVCRREDGASYQICPAEQERVVLAETVDDLASAVSLILKKS